MRWLGGVLVVVLMLVPAVALAHHRPEHPVPPGHQTTTTSTVSSTTSTSLALTTTTTQPTTSSSSSTTTTSSIPTTTTTVAPTTTTAPGTLVIPETLAYPSSSTVLRDGEGFEFVIGCEERVVDCDPNDSSGNNWIGEFFYFGHGMPYLYPGAADGHHDHAWWVPGDREGYACAYGFLYDQHPNPFGQFTRPGHFVARATIVRPPGNGYGIINDGYMEEAQRYYDGSLNFGDNTQEIEDEKCRTVAIDPDFDYENYQPHGADDIRIGLFADNPLTPEVDYEIADVRDITDFVRDEGLDGHFEFVGLESGGPGGAVVRAAFVHILDIGEQAGKISHGFYYDTLNDGRLAVEVNGLIVAEG